MALQTTVEQAEGPEPVTILALEGELDGTSYQGVIDTVRELYDEGTRHLVLDLGGLSFLSSAGLVALHSSLLLMRGEAPPDPEYGWAALHAIGAEVESGTQRTDIRLCGTRDGVQKVLDRTGLAPLFPTHPDRASAVAAF